MWVAARELFHPFKYDYNPPEPPDLAAWRSCDESAAAAAEGAMMNTSRMGEPVPAALLRCIVGNPFRQVALDPAWLTPTVTALAQAIYEGEQQACPMCRGSGKLQDHACERCHGSGKVPTGLQAHLLPILADALEEAGCTAEDILAHCRSGGEHVRGCWVVDLILGKQ